MPKIGVAIISILIFICAVFLIGLIWYKSFINSALGTNLEVEIPKGTTRVVFIENLSNQLSLGSVKKLFLKVYVYNNKSQAFEAGNYNFNGDSSYKYVFSNLSGGIKQEKITFLEGWRVEENALALKELVGKEYALEYLNKAKDLQGYLYPDTYFINPESDPQILIDAQQENYKAKVGELLSNYNGELSQKQVIVLASILERESLPNDDKRMIADILIKRYLNDLPLDADATTQYVVGSQLSVEDCLAESSCTTLEYWPKSLTKTQLESKNPYNTRGQLGLPPTPIANPAYNSVEAVVNPVNTPYLFYLHDSNGNTYFARDIDEHVENIRNYL